jgi:hypothetical protein
MVPVVKPNKLRICIDPFNLNQVIKREHHPMKTIEEVVSRLSGATVFSTLDAASGFWQIQLDEESANLTCFNTPGVTNLTGYHSGLLQPRKFSNGLWKKSLEISKVVKS